MTLRINLLVTIGMVLLADAATAVEDPREVSFERQVRPLLSKHCWSCHSEEAQENGLRLDRPEGPLAGGDHGPAVVPGKPDESLLILAVRRSPDHPAMPPDHRLSEGEVETLVNWVRAGAYWPKTDAADLAATRDALLARGRNHWALQPLVRPVPPHVLDGAWPRNPIDHFILARLESEGVEHAPVADRHTLARRIYFDLIGLPPTKAQIDRFVADDSPGAARRLVDQLLSRREYGEHWGRHWLDVARYADTTGYQEAAESRYPFAYTYRDYVIRSLNDDTPFNRFVVEQLAADQLELPPDEKWKLAALGFLTTGPRFNYNQHEIIDDRIDVVARIVGLDRVVHLRCHDHKYDAILADDYYGLYGVLASSDEPNYAELPRLTSGRGEFSRYRRFRQLVRQRTQPLVRFERETHERIQRELRNEVVEYLKYLVQSVPEHRTISTEEFNEFRYGLRGGTPYGPGVIVRWQHYLKQCGRDNRVFGLWNQLVQLPAEQFAAKSRDIIELSSDANPLVRERLLEAGPPTMMDVAIVYGDLLHESDRKWRRLRTLDANASELTDAAWEEIRQVLYGSQSPIVMDEDRIRETYRDDEFNQYMERKRMLDSTFVEFADVAAPRAMVMVDRPEPLEPRVFLRGDSTRPSRTVERRFPRVLASVDNAPYTQGSGRLELAHNIADEHNPLTARVIVNRVWRWHFGSGLVETTSDFGTRGTPPSHPELLDYLAAWFVDNGWSLKALHRHIMDSAVYQQSSVANAAEAEADPDNRLFARASRRRLGFEATRDSLLSVAGSLETREGGPPISELSADCRSVYLLIDRQGMSSVRQAFDFPSPEFTSSRRPETTSPQQALFFLNSPFVHQVVERIVDDLRQEPTAFSSAEQCVDWLYARILARVPSPREREQGARSLGQSPSPSRVYDFTHALMSSNEFLFVD